MAGKTTARKKNEQPNIEEVREGTNTAINFHYEGKSRKDFLKVASNMNNRQALKLASELSEISSLYERVDIEPFLKKVFAKYVNANEEPDIADCSKGDESRKRSIGKKEQDTIGKDILAHIKMFEVNEEKTHYIPILKRMSVNDLRQCQREFHALFTLRNVLMKKYFDERRIKDDVIGDIVDLIKQFHPKDKLSDKDMKYYYDMSIPELYDCLENMVDDARMAQ